MVTDRVAARAVRRARISQPGDLRAAAPADQRRPREDWSTRPTSGSCSAPASASATSSIPAWRRRDLAAEAAREAIARAGLTPDDIDFIVVGTATPDMMFPSTACLVQTRSARTHAWGFDLGAACSGVHLRADDGGADGRRRAAAQHALVIGADVMSSIIDYTDRATCVLFGDGAGAVVRRGRPTTTASASSTSSTRSTAAAAPRCACRPAAACSRRRTRPSTSGCTT